MSTVDLYRNRELQSTSTPSKFLINCSSINLHHQIDTHMYKTPNEPQNWCISFFAIYHGLSVPNFTEKSNGQDECIESLNAFGFGIFQFYDTKNIENKQDLAPSHMPASPFFTEYYRWLGNQSLITRFLYYFYGK